MHKKTARRRQNDYQQEGDYTGKKNSHDNWMAGGMIQIYSNDVHIIMNISRAYHTPCEIRSVAIAASFEL